MHKVISIFLLLLLLFSIVWTVLCVYGIYVWTTNNSMPFTRVGAMLFYMYLFNFCVRNLVTLAFGELKCVSTETSTSIKKTHFFHQSKKIGREKKNNWLAKHKNLNQKWQIADRFSFFFRSQSMIFAFIKFRKIRLNHFLLIWMPNYMAISVSSNIQCWLK